MTRPILLLLILLFCHSCKKTGNDEPLTKSWQTVLTTDDGWFGEIEIIGNDVYVLWTIPLPQQFSAKTRVYKSTDGGTGFNLLGYDQDELFTGIAFMDHSIGFMTGYRMIARTMDAGQTWDTTGMGLINFESIYVLNSRLIGYGTGIYFSDDTANTWLNAQQIGYYYNTLDFVDEQTGFAANVGGGLYKSYDAGISWQEVSILDNTEFYDIDFYDKIKGIAIVGEKYSPAQYPDMKLIRTEDGGTSWEQIDTETHGIKLDPTSCCVYKANDLIYLGGVNGIFYSEDKGMNWSTHYSEGSGIWTKDLEFQGDIGIATTGMGKVLKY